MTQSVLPLDPSQQDTTLPDKNWLRVDFHCHTIASKDSLTSPQRLINACRKKGLDRAAVTDHNTIWGAEKAKELDPQMVIVGEEIMTQSGELLAFFVREPIPSGLPAGETIRLLRQQGAFISVSHPFDTMRSGGWEIEALREIAPHVDAIETYNSRCFLPVYNRKAAEFSKALQMPGTVGSDAHTAWELGRSILLLPHFSDAEGLKRSIQDAVPLVKASPFWVHFSSRYAVLVKKLIHPRRTRR